jgi:hypothetical protein
VQRFNSSADLVELDRYAVRSFLMSCATDVAKSLELELSIDNGWLDWRVPENLAPDVCATAKDFVPVRKKSRPRQRGTYVILRKTS